MAPSDPNAPQQSSLTLECAPAQSGACKPVLPPGSTKHPRRSSKKCATRIGQDPEVALVGQDNERFLKRPAVQDLTTLSRSGIYRKLAALEFPAPIHLSPNTVVWLESEVHAWMRAQVEESRQPAEPSKPAKARG